MRVSRVCVAFAAALLALASLRGAAGVSVDAASAQPFALRADQLLDADMQFIPDDAPLADAEAEAEAAFDAPQTALLAVWQNATRHAQLEAAAEAAMAGDAPADVSALQVSTRARIRAVQSARAGKHYSVSAVKAALAKAKAEFKRLRCTNPPSGPQYKTCRRLLCRIKGLKKRMQHAHSCDARKKKIHHCKEKMKEWKDKQTVCEMEPERRGRAKRRAEEERERAKRRAEEERKAKEAAKKRAEELRRAKKAAEAAAKARKAAEKLLRERQAREKAERLRREAEARAEKKRREAAARREAKRLAAVGRMQVFVHYHRLKHDRDLAKLAKQVAAKHHSHSWGKDKKKALLEQDAETDADADEDEMPSLLTLAAEDALRFAADAPKPKKGKLSKAAQELARYKKIVAGYSVADLAKQLAYARKRYAHWVKQLHTHEKHLDLLHRRAAISLDCPKKKRPPPFKFIKCSASGDPHTDTWDGAHHDVMVAGWFTWLESPIVTIQAYTQLGCMPPSIPNTCIRQVVVRIRLPDSKDHLLVSYGSWPPARLVQPVMIEDTRSGKRINQRREQFGRGGVFGGGQFKISMSGANLNIQPVGEAAADPALAIHITIGTYLLAVSMPNAAPHKHHTNGMFGFMMGHKNRNDFAGIFRDRAGKAAPGVNANALCNWCGWAQRQTGPITAWAAKHVVTSAHGANPPIGFNMKLKQQKYINSYRRRFIELSQHAAEEEEAALAEMEAELVTADGFSPLPKKTKPLILPSVRTPVTAKKKAFCTARMAEQKKLLYKTRSKHNRKLTAKERQDRKDKFKARYEACLQDADVPSVAKTVSKALSAARKLEKSAKKAAVKVIAAREKKTKKMVAAGMFQLPIVYNADSPLSDADRKLIAKQHASLAVRGTPLLPQDVLDDAAKAVKDAQQAKVELLNKYPVKGEE